MIEYLNHCVSFWNMGGPINWIILICSFFLFLLILNKKYDNVFLNLLVSVFPSIGLLGTVVGMISTFNLISGGNLDQISSGIYTSLLTTLSGLFISLLGIFMLTFRKK